MLPCYSGAFQSENKESSSMKSAWNSGMDSEVSCEGKFIFMLVKNFYNILKDHP
jgi:hypothetical protein